MPVHSAGTYIARERVYSPWFAMPAGLSGLLLCRPVSPFYTRYIPCVCNLLPIWLVFINFPEKCTIACIHPTRTMIPNTDLLRGFEHVLNRDEKIVWIEKPKYIPYLAAGFRFAFFVFFFIGCSCLYEVTTEKHPNLGMWLVGPVFIAFSFWSFIRRRLDFKHACYAYTNKRILVRSGIKGKKIRAIEYDKVVEVTINVNAIERYYDAGSIKFFTGETKINENGKKEKVYDKVEAVPDPYIVFKNLKEVMSDFKTTS